MPAGVDVLVEDGYATIAFIDSSQKGTALSRLLAIGGPAAIEVLTREGPRRAYRVPECNARAAGLLDEPAPVKPAAESSTAATEPKKRGPGRPRKVDVEPPEAPVAESVRTEFVHVDPSA